MALGRITGRGSPAPDIQPFPFVHNNTLAIVTQRGLPVHAIALHGQDTRKGLFQATDGWLTASASGGCGRGAAIRADGMGSDLDDACVAM